MKVRLVSRDGKEKKIINEVVKNLDCSIEVEEISIQDKDKYNIKHIPAMIIENVIIGDINELSKNELSDIMYQFLETC